MEKQHIPSMQGLQHFFKLAKHEESTKGQVTIVTILNFFWIKRVLEKRHEPINFPSIGMHVPEIAWIEGKFSIIRQELLADIEKSIKIASHDYKEPLPLKCETHLVKRMLQANIKPDELSEQGENKIGTPYDLVKRILEGKKVLSKDEKYTPYISLAKKLNPSIEYSYV